MENNIYKLIGTMDLSNTINNNFLYPIFENNGDYYFENSFDNIHIDTFEKVYGLDHLKLIEKLDEKKLLSKPKKDYKIGDEAILVFRQNKDNIFIGTFDEFVEFYENIENKDKTLINIIDNIKEARTDSTNKEKIKIKVKRDYDRI